MLELTERMLTRFGFTQYEIMLSTRPDKSVGSDDIWDKATSALVDALGRKGWAYEVDEGGGAFYGPKIDLKIKDAIGRMWQCSTIQADFNLPERFGIEYTSADGTKQQPSTPGRGSNPGRRRCAPEAATDAWTGPHIWRDSHAAPRHLRIARALLRRAHREHRRYEVHPNPNPNKP